jgi:multidrug transporter EmrE-like cation transporter
VGKGALAPCPPRNINGGHGAKSAPLSTLQNYNSLHVIASAAKQSISPHKERMDCFAASGQLSQVGPISTRSWIFLVLSGLGTGASWLCYFRALKLGPATLVAPIDKLSVVLVALFGVVFLGERPTWNGWLGIALIAAGAVLIAVRR